MLVRTDAPPSLSSSLPFISSIFFSITFPSSSLTHTCLPSLSFLSLSPFPSLFLSSCHHSSYLRLVTPPPSHVLLNPSPHQSYNYKFSYLLCIASHRISSNHSSNLNNTLNQNHTHLYLQSNLYCESYI